MTHRLPLSEHASRPREVDPAREREIAMLVDEFYQRGRRDPIIGPVFEEHVESWDAHLSTMRDFWTSAMYSAGRYSGRPIDAHRTLAELGPDHFKHWLALWEETVDDVVKSDIAPKLIDFGRRMAISMSARLEIPFEPNQN